jgi:hypothetical protein
LRGTKEPASSPEKDHRDFTGRNQGEENTTKREARPQRFFLVVGQGEEKQARRPGKEPKISFRPKKQALESPKRQNASVSPRFGWEIASKPIIFS